LEKILRKPETLISADTIAKMLYKIIPGQTALKTAESLTSSDTSLGQWISTKRYLAAHMGLHFTFVEISMWKDKTTTRNLSRLEDFPQCLKKINLPMWDYVP
jgi:hypothetical protein